MTDVHVWLAAQLDHDELQARDVVEHLMDGGSHGIDFYGLPDPVRRFIAVHGVPGHVHAVVAAHRAILAEHQPQEDQGWEPGPDLCYTCRYDNGSDRYVHPCPTVRALTSIYAVREGFDPAWTTEEDGR